MVQKVMEEPKGAQNANKHQRNVIFISHATPGDNVFATWLASRLSMAGYEVWCDQEKLIGGEDFWKDIEIVLRNKAVKMVSVVSKNAFDENGTLRDGIAKEVALADVLKKKIGDDYFLVPMRIDETSYSDFPIDFLRLNGIDCAENWASGFAELLKVLDRDNVPRSKDLAEPSLAAWRSVHKQQSQTLAEREELLQSNWLPIEELSDEIFFYDILRPIKSSEPRAIASSCGLPCFDHGRLLGCFADTDELQSALGDTLPIKKRGALKTANFLQGMTGDLLGIDARDARNKITSMVRQAWDNALRERGLCAYEMANQKIAWWFPEGVPEDGQLKYVDFNDKPRRRAVSGIRGKKEGPNGTVVPRYYWHLGFTGRPFLSDVPVFVLQPRIIISEDAKTPLENKTKLNSVRRSLTRMWFNEKWRGLMLGFATWLADGNDCIELKVSGTGSVKLGARPLTFQAPISIWTDPISKDITEAEEEKNERTELHLRLSDPAFIYREDEEGEE